MSIMTDDDIEAVVKRSQKTGSDDYGILLLLQQIALIPTPSYIIQSLSYWPHCLCDICVA